MEMKSQLEEISLSHARVDKLVKACLESEPHNPIPTQTPSGVTLPYHSLPLALALGVSPL